MKKTRILASLLCLMMIVCALPMMQASAAVNASVPASAPFNLGVAVANVMNAENGNQNFKWARPYGSDEVVSWAAMNLDFTQDGMEGLANTTEALGGVTFDNTNGMTFSANKGSWRYFPVDAVPSANAAYWQPGADGQYYVYSFKVQEGGELMSWGAIAWGYNVAHVTATPNSVVIKSGNNNGSGVNDDTMVHYTEAGAAYKPGTEWNDVLVRFTGNTAAPYKVWMKKQSDATFTEIATADFPANVNGNGGSGNKDWGFGNDYTTTKKGLTFVGYNANVGYAASYKGVTYPVYQSIDEILGQETGSTFSFDFDENTNFANSTGRTGFTATGYISEADGMTLADPTDAATTIKFAPFGNYSPLNGTTNWNDQTYEPQALYIKAKGNFYLQAAGPKIYGRVYMNAKPGAEVWAETSASNYSNPLIIQDEWTEYLIVPNDLEPFGWISSTGYKLYVKAENATDGLWQLVKDCGYGKPSNGHASMGLSFYGVTGHIKSVKTIALSQSVSNAQATPAGADYLYFNEEFDQAPTYKNLSTSEKNIYENGYVEFPTTTASMDYIVKDLVIPVGGYLEFKAQYDGVARYELYDGEKAVSISQQSDYGTITGGLGYCGNNNTSWATWRIVRTENGYSIYRRNEGDNGWLAASTNTGGASTTAPMFKVNFGTKNGWTEEAPLTGASKLDYIKVYGPAPTSALTLTDGYTATALQDGATLTYPTNLRAIATADAGKLLVVSYNGNDMAKAQIVNVADMVNDSVFVDATAAGATRIKVFLWDSFEKLNKLSASVELGL